MVYFLSRQMLVAAIAGIWQLSIGNPDNARHAPSDLVAPM